MENFILDQVKPTLKYVPANLIKSYFKPQSNEKTKKFLETTGFIKGICHTRENFEQIKGANIEWTRFDIPFPLDADGNETPAYIGFKERVKSYRDNGIKVMAVTPFPDHFLSNGIDVRNEEGKKKIAEISEFLIKDLKDLQDKEPSPVLQPVLQ